MRNTNFPLKIWFNKIRNNRHLTNVYTNLPTSNESDFHSIKRDAKGAEEEKNQINLIFEQNEFNEERNLEEFNETINFVDKTYIADSKFEWFTSEQNNKLLRLHCVYYVNIKLSTDTPIKQLEDTSFEWCSNHVFEYFDDQLRGSDQYTLLQNMRASWQNCLIESFKFKWLPKDNEQEIIDCWGYYRHFLPYSSLMPTNSYKDMYYALILGFYFLNTSPTEKIELINRMKATSTQRARRAQRAEASARPYNFTITQEASDKIDKIKLKTGKSRSAIIQCLIDGINMDT
ncbi:MAG: hypothetical protein KAH18_13135 [Psychromonas sp.]|nr:hypothetical protein [Psychromonas sp.]